MRKIAELRKLAKDEIILEKPEPSVEENRWKRGPNQPMNPGNQNENHFRIRDWEEVYSGNQTAPYYDIAVVFDSEEKPADKISLNARIFLKGQNGRIDEREIELIEFLDIKEPQDVLQREEAVIREQLRRHINDMASIAVEGLEDQMQ